jgi:hypothetical protein
MTCAELYQLMANPVRLSGKTIPDLQQIVIDFPFFHAARLLYLKKLAITGDIRLQVELKKMAIHIPDRVKLYMLIESELPINPGIDQIAEKTDNQESVKDAEIAIPETDDLANTLPDESLTFETASLASIDYTRLLEDNKSKPAVSQPRMQHQDLIDSFIQNEQARSHSRIWIDPEKTGIDSNEMIKEQNDVDNPLENSYFTETLANIYIKKKRYDKALEIIKRLSLKYQKKNIYFADQIRYLEKLIIHTKK